uniref:Uncharacterized protein n=1 Tax=Solanum lycopersicum TaxID=4081 RepID=A0A3Q7IRI2_SOLLC
MDQKSRDAIFRSPYSYRSPFLTSCLASMKSNRPTNVFCEVLMEGVLANQQEIFIPVLGDKCYVMPPKRRKHCR